MPIFTPIMQIIYRLLFIKITRTLYAEEWLMLYFLNDVTLLQNDMFFLVLLVAFQFCFSSKIVAL